MATARPFAYNTGSPIPGTEQVGDLAVGYPTDGFASTGIGWWNGPDEDLGYVIAASVPGGNQPTPTPGGAYVGFWRSGELTEQSFVSLTNSIFGQSFSDGASAKTYLNSNGYWTSFVTTLLLDLYPNAAVAYSLRKLRSDYTGSAVRVRRSSDNAEQDIGFVGNDLDTTSMLDFVGYNLFLYSEQFDNAYWGKSNLNTTGTPAYIDVETAPDGTLTGDKMIENTANLAHGQTKTNVSLLASTDYNISVYLKAGERTQVYIDSEIEGTFKNAIIDLTNGTTISYTFTNAPVITSEANGWYRVSITVPSPTAGSRVPLRTYLYNGAFQYLGDGTSGAYIWGFQLSQTSEVKPYQKTVATAGGAGFVTTWYDQSTNANDSTQATATNQAQVVLNGNLILDVDTNKITTTWTSDRYSLTNGINPNTQYLSVSCARRQTTSGVLIGLGVSGTIGGSNGQTPLAWIGNGTLRSYMPTLVIHNTITTADGYIITSEKNASNLKTMYLNGSAQPTTATEAPASGTNINVFGQAGGNYTLGQYQEYVYWNSEQSANRTAIESNINNYWNAY